MCEPNIKKATSQRGKDTRKRIESTKHGRTQHFFRAFEENRNCKINYSFTQPLLWTNYGDQLISRSSQMSLNMNVFLYTKDAQWFPFPELFTFLAKISFSISKWKRKTHILFNHSLFNTSIKIMSYDFLYDMTASYIETWYLPARSNRNNFE